MRTLPVVILGYLLTVSGGLFAQEPELPLSEAIKIALANNRPAKILELDITKAQWAVASTKTKRLPSFSTYFFGSGMLTSSKLELPGQHIPDGRSPSRARIGHKDQLVSGLHRIRDR